MASKKLNVGDFGDEVARLHEDLKKGGIDVPASETKRKFFGPATREAISELQKKHGLNPTGQVDLQLQRCYRARQQQERSTPRTHGPPSRRPAQLAHTR